MQSRRFCGLVNTKGSWKGYEKYFWFTEIGTDLGTSCKTKVKGSKRQMSAETHYCPTRREGAPSKNRDGMQGKRLSASFSQIKVREDKKKARSGKKVHTVAIPRASHYSPLASQAIRHPTTFTTSTKRGVSPNIPLNQTIPNLNLWGLCEWQSIYCKPRQCFLQRICSKATENKGLPFYQFKKSRNSELCIDEAEMNPNSVFTLVDRSSENSFLSLWRLEFK